VGILVALAAIALLGVFAWPLLHPETVGGPKPASAPAAVANPRSQAAGAEAASSPNPAPASAPAAEAHAAPPAADEPAGPLCDQKFEAAAARALPLPAGATVRRGPPVRGAAWTWVNLWAAWCKPCKEEMPLLVEWAQALRARGAPLKVVFVSLDDDERQLQRYLKAEGAGIDGEVLWASDAAGRARFLQGAGLATPPTLPAQILLDPQGRMRCLRSGSVTRRDLDEATRTFGW
jgi:thiol-disulfide isomerase/thioredoxin